MSFQNTWPSGPGQSRWLCGRAIVSVLKFERNRGGLEMKWLKHYESGEKPGPLGPNKSDPKGSDKSDSSDFFINRNNVIGWRHVYPLWKALKRMICPGEGGWDGLQIKKNWRPCPLYGYPDSHMRLLTFPFLSPLSRLFHKQIGDSTPTCQRSFSPQIPPITFKRAILDMVLLTCLKCFNSFW